MTAAKTADKRRNASYDDLIKKMKRIAGLGNAGNTTTWKPPSRLSVLLAKYRIRAFVRGDRAPEPPAGMSWHTRFDRQTKDFTIRLGKSPKSRKAAGRAARKATRK